MVDFDPAQFRPTEASIQEMELLIEAADAADELFWRQASPGASAFELLELAGNDHELKEMILFHCGPYDRMDDDSPLLPIDPKPLGAGFYPPDLTREEFTAYVRNHPDGQASFESPYTLIKRVGGSNLAAVPYHEAYREQVIAISTLLAEASHYERHGDFRVFLVQRAKDLLTDDYYASEAMWVGLEDNPLDLVIGPYEVYEDRLLGLKASYEAMILARDLAESAKVEHFHEELPSLCRRLEQETGRRLNIETTRVALSVANLVYAGGDARKAIPAIAFNLPNDERIIEEVGCRQVILKNVLEAKFRLVDWQLHQRVLDRPLKDENLAFCCFSDHTLLHEISHSIGPHRITKDGELSTVNRSLRQYHSVLEEAKADTLAACFVLNRSNESDGRAFLETYVAGFLRAIRFGLSTAHGGANAMQFNFLLHDGGIALRSEPARMSVDHEKARKSLIRLVSEIVGIQERGDFEAASHLVGTFCAIGPEMSQLLDRVSDLPIDIRIRFKSKHDYLPIEQLADRAVAT